MSDASGTHGDGGVRPLDVIVSVVVLFVLAVAQPLLDLLGRNAEFFLARSSPALDIVALSVILTLVLPLLLGLLIVWVGRAHEPTGRLLHGVVLAFLGGVLALQVIELTSLMGSLPRLEIALALGIGAAVAVAFYRFEAMQSAARFASIAPLVVLGLFLFGSSASQLIFASAAVAQPAEIAVGNPAPVVMIVFDEFPIASLMDADGNLQEDVYPGFARLAQDGTWFRNATTIQQQTENSLPAILSGKNPPGNKIPIAADHPFTLFTLLGDSYDLNVVETVTDLCPEYACANTTRPQYPASERWSTLIDDLQVVAAHLFLPAQMTEDLPPIDSSWSNFSGDQAGEFDMIGRFQVAAYETGRLGPIADFLESITPSDGEPSLHYMHVLLPHVPWEFLPTGQLFVGDGGAPGSKSPGWGSDEWLVDQAYQRHLMQVGLVDAFVVDLIDHLESQDMYEDALIVVLADHGVAVRPDIRHRRVVTDDTVGDIAAIPLFIKRPHQESGAVDDYRAETVDVLPTIADVLGINVPWSMDGTSLFSGDRPERLISQIDGTEGVITFGVDGSEARALAARKIEHFGSQGPFGLAPPGHADLLGVSVATLDMQPTESYKGYLADPAGFRDVDVDAPVLPTWVRGTVTTGDRAYKHLIVAVAVNGEIAAITRTHETEEGNTAFGAMLPPDSLVNGDNTVTLILIEGSGATRTFSPLTN